MSTKILPWHAPQWQRLCTQFKDGKPPHGILLTGAVDSGKSLFVSSFSERLLCQGNQPPCGVCNQCNLVSAQTHPDLLTVTLQDSKQIKIEQIRDVIYWANQTAQQGGWKICVVNPADKLNTHAANALLKSLEEPPAKTLIILVTDQPSRMLPTLRSRCQHIDCQLPSRVEALDWLKSKMDTSTDIGLLLDIANGVPLRALNSIDEDYLALRQKIAATLLALPEGVRSPILAASELKDADPLEVLNIAYLLVSDSIAYALTTGNSDKETGVVRNIDLEPLLKTYAGLDSIDDRYQLLDRITSARGMILGTSNANPQMLIEWVFIKATQ